MKWISVKDRLPEQNKVVLIYDRLNGFEPYCTGFLHSGVWERFGDFKYRAYEVTYWMEFPKFPEEQNEMD